MHRVSSTGNAASTSRPRKEKRVTFVVGNSRSAKHCSGINAVAVDRATAEGGLQRDILFTGSRDGTVKRWELEESSAECGATFESHVDWVNDITWVGKDKLVSCSSDTTLKVWGAFSQGECLKTLRQHTDYVTCVSAARETNTVASAGLSCEVFIWDIEAALAPVARSPPQSAAPQDGTSSPPPVRAADTMGVYRAASIAGMPVGSSLSNPHLAYGGGHGMTNGSGGGGRAGSPPDTTSKLGYVPVVARGHKESVYSLAVNDAGTVVVSGGTEKAIRVWDPRTGTKTMKLKGHTDNIRALVLDPTGRMCLSGSSDSIIRLWDLGQQRCIRSFAVHTDSVWALAATSDFGSVFSGGRDKAVYKTDLHTSETLLLCQEQHPVLSLGLQDEDAIWVATTDSSLRKWSATDDISSSAHARSSFHAGPLPFVRASLEGALAAAPLHSKPLVTISGTAGIVQHSILNDKRHVLTKDADGVVKLWELTRGVVVEDYGKVSFEEKDKDLFEQVSVPSWFSMDTRLGSISVHLETPQCFAAEMYATDLGVEGASEELKLNLGQHTLRGLFVHWANRWRQRVESQASSRGEPTAAMDVDRDAGSAAVSGRPSGADEAPPGEAGDVLAGVLPAFEFSTVCPPSIVTEGLEGGPWRKAATDLDGTEDEKDIPRWCMECVLDNRLPPREPAKCSFHLHPHDGSGLRTLTSGKLSAPRILRIQKVMNYVQDRLTQERPADSEYGEGEPSPTTSPQPSGNGNGHNQNLVTWNPRQMLFEILCNDQVLPQEMSLASVRTYVWKRPEDLLLSYRLSQGPPPPSNHLH